MPDMGDYLLPRYELIGQAFSGIKSVWQWIDFDYKKTKLNVGKFKGDGSLIRYQQDGNWEGAAEATIITPIDIQNRKSVDIPVGAKKILDHLVANARNYDGVVDVPIEYVGAFRKLRSASEAFAYGFTQSVTLALKFTQGGEASFAKFEQELTLGFESRQDWTTEEGSEDEESRSAGISPDSPPGYDIQYTLTRTTQPMKLKVTGIAKIDHGVQIGKYHKGWKGNHGKNHKLYPRWAKYDSFYEELLPVIKGEGRRDLMFAEHFKRNPAPAWLIKELEKPLKIPFEHTSEEFDGATILDQEQIVLRGPKN